MTLRICFGGTGVKQCEIDRHSFNGGVQGPLRAPYERRCEQVLGKVLFAGLRFRSGQNLMRRLRGVAPLRGARVCARARVSLLRIGISKADARMKHVESRFGQLDVQSRRPYGHRASKLLHNFDRLLPHRHHRLQSR